MQRRRTLRIAELSAHSLSSADGHDVDPVDAFRLVLQTRLDATDQCLDLGTAQAIVNVNPGDDPYPARTDEGEQELADGGHAGVPEDKGSGSLLISWPERLGQAGDITALLPARGPRPGARAKAGLPSGS